MIRDRASIVYGILDILFAAAYVGLFLWVIPSRSPLFSAIAVGLSVLMALGGLGMLSTNRWGRLVAMLSSLVMLAACLVLILLIVASMAYLHGIYDGIGQAGVAIGALAALLSIEVIGLLPALQLAHLRRSGRGTR